MKKTLWDRFPELKKIPQNRLPHHVFIIPDGNGRWAKARNKFVTFGHKKGLEVAYSLLEDLADIHEIKIVSIWGFSADNWKRSEREVKGLMLLFEKIIKKTVKDLQKRNGRFIHIGRRDRIPAVLKKIIEESEKDTAQNTGQIVCLAIDFSGEDQEQRIVAKALKLASKRLNVWDLRDGKGLVKSADLLIRTSGELRISDVGWINGAPTELYFTPKYFPDITTADIVEALVDFAKRERRMGGRKASE